MWSKVINKMLIREDGGLFEPIHALFYFDIYKTIGGYYVLELVLIENVRWDMAAVDLHIFWSIHWGSQEVIF